VSGILCFSEGNTAAPSQSVEHTDPRSDLSIHGPRVCWHLCYYLPTECESNFSYLVLVQEVHCWRQSSHNLLLSWWLGMPLQGGFPILRFLVGSVNLSQLTHHLLRPSYSSREGRGGSSSIVGWSWVRDPYPVVGASIIFTVVIRGQIGLEVCERPAGADLDFKPQRGVLFEKFLFFIILICRSVNF